MQQRQLRLGDILDDYCPRERRITNHAVVAMVGQDVKQTRCTTCDTEHEYKHAKVPRQRRKSETPAALYAQVLADGPKRVAHDPTVDGNGVQDEAHVARDSNESTPPDLTAADSTDSKLADAEPVESDSETSPPEGNLEDGPVHRPLIRATLPRPEGQPPPTRPAPEFTIRHPGGRPNRFRHRHGRGGQPFQGNRSNGNMGGNMGGGPPRGGGMPRHGGGRPPVMSRLAKRQGQGRKRSK
jgi:hypothetical protein